MSHKYLGIDPPDEAPAETRLIVRVIPEHVVNFSVQGRTRADQGEWCERTSLARIRGQ